MSRILCCQTPPTWVPVNGKASLNRRGAKLWHYIQLDHGEKGDFLERFSHSKGP